MTDKWREQVKVIEADAQELADKFAELKLRAEVAENNLAFFKGKCEAMGEHIDMIQQRLDEKTSRVSILEGNPQPIQWREDMGS